MPAGDQLRHLAIEEGQQQRGDMRAVDIGVGHDDDALIAQIAPRGISRPCRSPAPAPDRSVPGSAAACRRRRWRRSGSCRAAAGSPGWRGRAPAWREPPALSPSTRNISVPSGRVARAVGQLAGQAQLARRRLARDFLFLPALAAGLRRWSMTKSSSLSASCRAFRQPVIEMIAHHVLDQALRVGRGELVLGLALEFRLADEDRQHGAGRRHHIVGGDQRRSCGCWRARHGRAAPWSARCAGPVHGCRPAAWGWCCNRSG